MTAKTTTTRNPAMLLAQQVISDARAGKFRTALTKARRGAEKFPTFVVPAAQGQPSPTFAQLAEWLGGQADAAERKDASAAESAPVAEPKPAPEPERVKVETITLRLVHDGINPTSIFGIGKDTPAHRVVGAKKNGGLGWFPYSSEQGFCFYLPRSGKFAPNMDAIGEVITRLQAQQVDGVQLYRVETQIVTEMDGKPLPVRMTAAQRQEWQKRFDAARNALDWGLGLGRGECRCGVKGLDRRTGRIGKDAQGMPVVECHTCGGFDAPAPVAEPAPVKVDLSALFALAATPAPVPESAECPSCRTMQPVEGGKFKLHSRPFSGGACRGKLGVPVEDVEAEPAQQPVRKARKAAAAPVPVQAEETVSTSGDGVWRFRLQAGLSGKARNETATDVRSALTHKVANKFRGTRIETRRDKVNHMLVLTVIELGEGVDLALVEAAVLVAVRSVRGVGNQIHKA